MKTKTNMNKIYILLSVAVCLSLYSCGGVIGNIERYTFENITRDSLKEIVAKVREEHPELTRFDTTKYKEGVNGIIDGDYFCRIQEDGLDMMFVYAYPHAPVDTSIEIALLSAGTYQEVLPLAKDITASKKRYYKQLFEKHFINYIYTKLNR